MEKGINKTTYQWYLWGGVLLFFFNDLLPANITLTLLLCPYFLYVIAKESQLKTVFVLTNLLLIYSVFSINSETQFYYLFRSLLIGISLIIGIVFFVNWYKKHPIETVMEYIAKLNIVFLVIALLILPFESSNEWMWYYNELNERYDMIPRLSFFHLEASHLSLALTPVFLFYLWSIIQTFSWKKAILLSGIMASLILSFSLGVWAALSIAMVVLYFTRMSFVFKNKKLVRFSRLTIVTAALVGLIVWQLFPDNLLTERIKDVMDGTDTSGRGRTYEAFYLAHIILQEHDALFFGIGLGQLKVLAVDSFINFYKYTSVPDLMRIPNSSAETLVVFGYVGLSLRLLIQLYFFLRTKVFQDLFRLSLFLFLFTYQFTGSYIFSFMEYVLFVICFVPKFSYLTFNPNADGSIDGK